MDVSVVRETSERTVKLVEEMGRQNIKVSTPMKEHSCVEKHLELFESRKITGSNICFYPAVLLILGRRAELRRVSTKNS